MPSTASGSLLLELQAAGENLGTWGDDRLNKLFRMLEAAGQGLTSHTLTGNVSLTYTNYTLTNGVDFVQHIASGSTGGFTLTLAARERTHLIINASNYTQTIATSGGGASVEVDAGQVAIVYCDGTRMWRVFDGADKDYVLATFLQLAGGTMTGPLVLNANGSAALHPVSVQQLNAAVLAAAAGNLPALTTNALKFLRVNAGETSVEWAALSVAFADLTGKPTTIGGYGITDAYTEAEVDAFLAAYLTTAAAAAGYQPLDGDLTALAAISGVRGDIIYRNASTWVRLPKGTVGQALLMGADDPYWGAISGGAMFTDPDRFAKWTPISTALTDGANTAAASGFFTNMGQQGVNVNSNFTADTYKTIASISGSGEMIGAIGPTAGGAETTTFRFTVDGGATQEVAIAVPGSGDRAVLGPLSHLDQAVAGTGVPWTADQDDLDAAKRHADPSTDKFMYSSMAARAHGLPRLRFETSLVVEMKHSANVTGTGSQERQAAVTYVLD